MRLREGSEADALTAAYIEPRVQYSTIAALAKMTQHASIAAPFPDDIPCDAPWSFPEILRVDAELLLWRGERGAVSAAESEVAALARTRASTGRPFLGAPNGPELRPAENATGSAGRRSGAPGARVQQIHGGLWDVGSAICPAILKSSQ